MSEVERYLDVNPFYGWDRDKMSEYDFMVDARFHKTDVNFTPLMNYVQLPAGIGWDQYYYTATEIVPAHHNTNDIGRYARFIDSIYVDTRQKRLKSTKRFGGKTQWNKKDTMVTRYGNDTDAFIKAAMNAQLLDGVVKTHETLARNALIDNALHKFLGDGSVYSSTNNFANLAATDAYKFDLKFLEDMSLRLSYRVEDTLHQWGDYAQPVPGSNFRDNVLVMVPTPVYWDLWNSEAKEWLIDLRQLQDGRILNGAKAQLQYRNITIADYGHSMSLMNAGAIAKQVTVTSPIKWGDGAPDPDAASDNTVDNVWLVGQSSSEVTHYVQCSDLGTSLIKAGDIVTLHAKRTSAFGVTGGVDFEDGETMNLEVYSVDETNERLTFRKPITHQFDKPLAASVYAYITKARNVFPVYAIGARGMCTWASRQGIEWNRPTDNDADFPSVERVTWNEYGEFNPWNGDLFEIDYCVGSFGNRGAVAIQ